MFFYLHFPPKNGQQKLWESWLFNYVAIWSLKFHIIVLKYETMGANYGIILSGHICFNVFLFNNCGRTIHLGLCGHSELDYLQLSDNKYSQLSSLIFATWFLGLLCTFNCRLLKCQLNSSWIARENSMEARRLAGEIAITNNSFFGWSSLGNGREIQFRLMVLN